MSKEMTNKTALLEELMEMSGKQIDFLLMSRQSYFPEVMHAYLCEDCKSEHGGKCPVAEEDDAPCALTMGDWLERPCTREKMIDWEALV